jgi:MoxR-like ATPase
MVDNIEVDDSILNYIIDIAEATRRAEELTVGLSPRGSLALMQAAKAAALLDNREFVIPDDVKNLAPSVCAHRLLARSFAHDGAASAAEAVFIRILETIPAPQ